MRYFILSWLLCSTVLTLQAQRDHAFAVNDRLGRGINYGNMLEAPTETAWSNPWQPEYPEIIAELGFSHVRIPIRWEPEVRSANTPPYSIDPDFMSRVKEVVDATLDEGLMAVINMHHHDSLYEHPDEQRERFLAQWEQISAAFKDYPDDLVFELLNEPHGNLTPEKWNELLRDGLAAIRTDNPDRVVLIGTPEYGGLGGLPELELPDDPNIILTIHYYNPFQFTHQGADWVAGDADAWLGTEWQDTDVERAAVQSEFAPLIALSESEHVPVHIGEFGAFSTADIASRERWTTYLSRYFEEQGWSWAYWEFSAGFGIYDPDDETFIQELVDALLHNEMPEPAIYERTVVYQSDFTGNTDGWQLYTNGTGVAELAQVDGTLEITVSNGGTEAWHVQLVRNNLSLTADKKYAVTFTGRSREGSRGMTWYVGMSVDPWSAYSSWNQASLTEELTTFTTTFDMTQTDPVARIALDLGTEAGDVIITEVRVEELELNLPDNEEPDEVLSTRSDRVVSVYPNPTADRLYVENRGSFHRLTLFSLSGQKLLSHDLSEGLNVIRLETMKPDLYVLLLEGKKGREVFKVLKR